jgi:hypothetical protein
VIEAMINQTRQQTKYCMGFSSHGSKKGNHNYNNNYNYMNEDDDASIEKMRKEIEANQDSALSLCTEKVLLARQAYELVSFCFSFDGLDKRVLYIAFIRLKGFTFLNLIISMHDIQRVMDCLNGNVIKLSLK